LVFGKTDYAHRGNRASVTQPLHRQGGSLSRPQRHHADHSSRGETRLCCVSRPPFHFDQPGKLVESLRGVDTLITLTGSDSITDSHATNRRETPRSVEPAKDSGVRRIVSRQHLPSDLKSDCRFPWQKPSWSRRLMTWASPTASFPDRAFGRRDCSSTTSRGRSATSIFGVFGRVTTNFNRSTWTTWRRQTVEKRPGMDKLDRQRIGRIPFTYRSLVATIGEILAASAAIISVSPAWVTACRA